MKQDILTLCLLFYAGRDVASSLSGQSAVSIADNGYNNVAVAIQSGVPKSDELIDKIKDMFTDGSTHLYEATNHRLFFHDVTIFVPQTWPPNASYLTHSIARFENSDVIIEPPNDRSAPLPYTRQHRGCGLPGLSINVMYDFLLDPNNGTAYASQGQLLIHEWGHYRWGLFDEYPDDVTNQFYYSSLTNQFEGVRCSYNITGTPLTLDKDGVTNRHCVGNSSVGYEDGCLFVPSETQQDVTGSIMYGRGKYSTITDFCDSDPGRPTSLHNSEAPNRHNRLCDRRSNWEVMREHSDLMDGNNPPRELSASDLVPVFHFVQLGTKRVVLVLETSYNMAGAIFNRMVNAAAAFISWVVPVGVAVGVVGYKDTATKLSGLVNIQSDADRKVLLDSLPTGTSGHTSVGDGLFKAIELLQESGSETEGDCILLINGFKGDTFPTIGFVKDRVIEAGVIVDSVAMTQEADPQLAELSQQTGGTFYFADSDAGTAYSLNEAFRRTIDTSDVSASDINIQILSDSLNLLPGESRSGVVYLDTTIGKETKFMVSWLQQGISATPNVNLIDPKGFTLTASYPGYENDTKYGLIVYHLEGIAEEGQWTIEIENTDLSLQTDVQLSVTSAPRDANIPPISVASSISELTKDFAVADMPLTIYAEVHQGYKQVINAVVKALVTIPTVLVPVEMQLLDTGTGADVTRNDGIYSGYYTNYTVDGFYGITISAQNNGDATVINFASASERDTSKISSPRRDYRTIGVPAPIFQRVVSAGSSQIVNVPAVGTDAFPPGKITDLRIVTSAFANKTVTLAWTATGDDYDSGKASSYELTRADDAEAILTNNGTVKVQQSDVIQGDLSDPRVSGSVEEFTIIVPVDTEISPFAFSVIAQDEANLKSPISNIVLVAVRRYIPTPPESTTTESPGTGYESLKTLAETTEITGKTNATEITAVGVSIPVLSTRESILTREEIIITGVLGSIGLLLAVIIASVSIAKCYSNHTWAPAPSRPGSERSTGGLRGSEKQVELIQVIDLEMQGTASEI